MANKVIYELKRYHHRKAWRNGDLEDETIQDFSQNFSTRTEANNFLEKEENKYKREKYSIQKTIVKRGDKPSKLLVFTGETWVNENSGSNNEEYYHYIVNKKTL